MTLEFEDYEIHEAADGAFGLRTASAVGPDLVLLDVMMPGELDGLQVCQRIRSDPRPRTSSGSCCWTARGRARPRGGQQSGADDHPSSPSARCSSSRPSSAWSRWREARRARPRKSPMPTIIDADSDYAPLGLADPAMAQAQLEP